MFHKKIILAISLLSLSMTPIKKEKTIEIDNEKIQRYNEEYGVWEDKEFKKMNITEKEKNILKYNRKYLFPLKTKKVTSGFGVAGNRIHFGVDYEAKINDIVVSSQEGKVIESGYKNSLGNYIIIKDEDQICFTYAHLSRRYVKIDDIIEIGQIIGRIGTSGNSTGPHLHLEISYQNIYLNHHHFFN